MTSALTFRIMAKPIEGSQIRLILNCANDDNHQFSSNVIHDLRRELVPYLTSKNLSRTNGYHGETADAPPRLYWYIQPDEVDTFTGEIAHFLAAKASRGGGGVTIDILPFHKP